MSILKKALVVFSQFLLAVLILISFFGAFIAFGHSKDIEITTISESSEPIDFLYQDGRCVARKVMNNGQPVWVIQ